MLLRAQGAVIEEAVPENQPPPPHDESELQEVTAEKKLVVVDALDVVAVRPRDAEKEGEDRGQSLRPVGGVI